MDDTRGQHSFHHLRYGDLRIDIGIVIDAVNFEAEQLQKFLTITIKV
jgi:hypothetical protein